MARRIAAAGGVVWRGHHSRVEVALVHRPRYDDWSLPKGKLEPPESLLATAVREVAEELGAAAVPSRRLGSVRYDIDGDPKEDGKALSKEVTFWAMQYRGGSFTLGAEVDEAVWLHLGEAVQRLTYDSDRTMLEEFAALPPPDSVIVLVRHAKAGKRSEWAGSDDKRPLDLTGRAQAAALAGFLGCFGVDRVVSANRTRCIETVEPFAKTRNLIVEVEPIFSDELFAQSPSATQTALLALAKPGHVTVVCSQGLTIPTLVERLGNGVIDSDTKKGAAWVLSLVDGDVISADYYEGAAGAR